MNERQVNQLAFAAGDENLVVGDLSDIPFDFSIREFFDEEHMGHDPSVGMHYGGVQIEAVYKSGLTAIVYKLKYADKFYNLKRSRDTSLVKNADGQTAFLNEVQRRKDFEILRKDNPIIDQGIVRTIYADYRQGFMLSEWIEGSQIKAYGREIFRSLFELTWQMEMNGIMEWDLCSGNLLVDEASQVQLFDFGYAYTYDPLTQYNSEGKSNPLFNSVERFETRAFMPYLMEIQDEEDVYRLYLIEKEEAIRIYGKKKRWLEDHKADTDLIQTCNAQIAVWEKGLENRGELVRLYRRESARSYVLDIHDDIGGKSCTPKTLLKIDKMIEIISQHHDYMVLEDAYLWDDRTLNRDELLDKYREIRRLAENYQVG